MKKLFKKLSVLLIGVLACAMLLMACTPAKDVAEGVKEGASDITKGVKEGAADIKKGAEDMGGSGENQGNKSKGEFDSTQSKASNAALVGTWTGTEADGDHIRISLYEDSTYEIVERDKNDKEKSVASGRYTVDATSITFNKEKKLEHGKTVDNKDVDKLSYTLENGNSLKLKDDNGKETFTLHKENKLADKIIK